MNGFAMFVYKCLGIPQFKRIVLSLEKLRHRKDGLRNRNYHPQNLSVIALENYYWYLIYNSFLHVISLFVSGLYFVFIQIWEIHFVVVDFLIWILVVFNVYCIILQRYNILKLRNTYRHCQEKQDATYEKYRLQLREKELPCFSDEELCSDYEVLIKIKKYIDREAGCSITSADIPSLTRFSILLSQTGIAAEKQKVFYKTVGEAEKGYAYLRNMEPYGRVDILVGFIRKIFDKKNYAKYSGNYYLCTENGACEDAFKKVFSTDSYECISQIIRILYYIYSERLLVKNENY